MSLEQTIANLQQQAGLLLDLPQQIATTATQQIDRVGNAYATILASQVTSFFVDQENGLDTNEGTDTSPLKTIGAAINLTPLGGICNVYLKSDYHMDVIIRCDAIRLVLRSDTQAIKRRLTFEVVPNPESQTLYQVNGFLCFSGLKIWLINLVIVWPEVPVALQNRASDSSALVTGGYCHDSVAISSCELQIPPIAACRFFQGLSTFSLYVLSVTYTGSKTSANGWWLDIAFRESGTSVNSVGNVISNLDYI